MSTANPILLHRTTWNIDVAHSSLAFAVRHLAMSKVHGRFDRWSGSMRYDEAYPERTLVEVRVEAASINTHEPQRDEHLRSSEFLDIERYPDIAFKSTRVEKQDERRFHLAGDLAIAGVSRLVILEVQLLGQARDPQGAERMGFSARTAIDRRDFGLVWNQALEAGGLLVGEKVEIEIEIEAVKQA